MNPSPSTGREIREILWESLDGSDYDRAELERSLEADTRLDELLDSLDISDFALRLEHRFSLSIAHEDFPHVFGSLSTIESYVRNHGPAVPAGEAPAAAAFANPA